jgi:hypothetical protein
MIAILLRRLYNNFVGSDNIIYDTLPTSADTVQANAVTLTAKAAAWQWTIVALVIAATSGAAECQLYGATMENFVGAATQGEVRVLLGAAPPEVEIARWPISAPVVLFPKPIRIPAASRVVGAYRTATGAADSVDVKLLVLRGF